MTRGILVLASGKIYEGRSFGYEGESFGEVVFNTGMTGYQEILTDPSYSGQIVILTTPMIGNYGVNCEDTESRKPQAAGLIVKEYCDTPSNWRIISKLADYLKENRVVGVDQMPTREIVRHIREKGAMPGILAVGEWDEGNLLKRAARLGSMEGQNLVGKVATEKPLFFYPKKGKGQKKSVVLLDFGFKQNIVRELLARNCEVKVIPPLTPPREILEGKPDGIVLSNGPGDPAACVEIIKNVRLLIGPVPLLGICLGHQLLALALGAKTFKLKFGHRGLNQPVKDLFSGRVRITSQNHGFAVDSESIPKEMEITEINLNDRTVEGFRHRDYPLFAIQYHPEASPGPHDAKNIFDEFCARL